MKKKPIAILRISILAALLMLSLALAMNHLVFGIAASIFCAVLLAFFFVRDYPELH